MTSASGPSGTDSTLPLSSQAQPHMKRHDILVAQKSLRILIVQMLSYRVRPVRQCNYEV